MKTTEEIKKGLECRKRGYTEKCDRLCSRCMFYVPQLSIAALYADALAYIQQLEALKQPETLVRCGECMRYMPEPMGDMMMCYGFANGHFPAPDDFCSRGVRRK